MDYRKCTVFVSKEDKEKLQKNCEEIKAILEKYPYSNDPSDDFVTSMSRVKSHFHQLDKWVNILEVNEGGENIKLLIQTSANIETADEIINDSYNFKSIEEKIAFLQGMFGIEIVDVYDSEGTSKDDSAKMTYFAMLNCIINM